MDMGLRSRLIHQQGRLQAETAGDLSDIIALIEQFIDGELHTLVENHGITYSSVLLETFQPEQAIRKGRNFWCEYSAVYRQLP